MKCVAAVVSFRVREGDDVVFRIPIIPMVSVFWSFFVFSNCDFVLIFFVGAAKQRGGVLLNRLSEQSRLVHRSMNRRSFCQSSLNEPSLFVLTRHDKLFGIASRHEHAHPSVATTRYFPQERSMLAPALDASFRFGNFKVVEKIVEYPRELAANVLLDRFGQVEINLR